MSQQLLQCVHGLNGIVTSRSYVSHVFIFPEETSQTALALSGTTQPQCLSDVMTQTVHLLRISQ